MPTAVASPACSPREPGDYHPLEIIPYFRRFDPSHGRDLVYTFIWNLLLTAAFVLVGLLFNSRGVSLEMVGRVFVIAQCIGYTIHAFYFIGGVAGLDRRVHRRGGIVVAVYYSGIACLGVLAGFAIAGTLLDMDLASFYTSPKRVGSILLNSLVISAILSAIFFAREREAKSKAALVAERLRAEQVERQATLANLRALQAQIEPHFLFNTLANATSLIDADPARAKHMLEAFIRFLRASLAATRRSTTTLADEFAMLHDFLEVLAVRMADRLTTRVDLPEALAAIEIPPMLLQPLVENAIRHGLEPKIEGGAVEISARLEEDRLVLQVTDTGVGFRDSGSGGVGLENIRERLRLAYGEAGRLSIREGPAGGTIATVTLPGGAH
ncbi:MAG: sensor histidine kinase [Betaproteobacteria bacterium]|nr:sensor histidine kinase [Betaproteobacteria bacterium]